MDVLSSQIDASKKLVEELIELLHIPSDNRYQKFFHSSDYSLFVEYSGTGSHLPNFRVHLTKKSKLHNGSGKAGPIEDTLMGFQKDVTDGSISCGGHGDMAEVVKGLEELHSLYTKVINPLKDIVRELLPKTEYVRYSISLDVADAMVTVTSSEDKYSIDIYRGCISPAPTNVNIRVLFDKDFNIVSGTRVNGPMDRVHFTMEFVHKDVLAHKFKFIKEILE